MQPQAVVPQQTSEKAASAAMSVAMAVPEERETSAPPAQESGTVA
jgi:hypothetical protein